MKTTLVSFGNRPWENAIKRLSAQAKDSLLFNNIFILNEETLDKETSFNKENYDILFPPMSVPGYGLWLWKSYILEKAFEKFPDSDFFMYLDSGSELNITEKTKKRFYDYVEIADSKNIFGFRNNDVEANLSHCSVIDRIYIEGKHTLQFEANTLIFKNNNASLDIIKEWKSLCRENKYRNILTLGSKKCCDLYGHHLHDQSVLSCLLKKNGIEGIYDEGSWYLPSHSVSSSMEENRDKYPIFTARNPFDYSIVDRNCLRYKEFSTCRHYDGAYDCQDTLVVR